MPISQNAAILQWNATMQIAFGDVRMNSLQAIWDYEESGNVAHVDKHDKRLKTL